MSKDKQQKNKSNTGTASAVLQFHDRPACIQAVCRCRTASCHLYVSYDLNQCSHRRTFLKQDRQR